MFEIFHLQSDACLKASLALMHSTTFILRSLNQDWEEKGSVLKFIFSIVETFHAHRHTRAHCRVHRNKE